MVLENLFHVVGILTHKDTELRRRFGLTGVCEVRVGAGLDNGLFDLTHTF